MAEKFEITKPLGKKATTASKTAKVTKVAVKKTPAGVRRVKRTAE